MGESRFRPTANDSWCLVHQVIIGKRLNHEKREIDPARQITRQNGITNMATPDRQTLTLSFFEIAAAHHRPPRPAVEDSSASFLLIADFDQPEKLSERAENRHQRFELPRVTIFAIHRDMPAAGEYQSGPGLSEIQNRLSSA